jgi:transcriptional regulator with XRE-family HTH domain
VATASITLDRLRANITMRLRLKGVRQGQMAKALGMTDSWISMILSGRRAVSLQLIDRLAEYFECAPAALFDALDETPPHSISGGAGHATQTRVLERRDDQRRADRQLLVQLWAQSQQLYSGLMRAKSVISALDAELGGALRPIAAEMAASGANPRRPAPAARAAGTRRRPPHRAVSR